ncbi:hypothetical protein ACQ4PT_071266 [Festuca glaucescens]
MARPSSVLLVLAALVSVLVSPASAAEKTGQITVFWGRHADEGTLGDACNFDGIYTAVNMAFLNVYGHGSTSWTCRATRSPAWATTSSTASRWASRCSSPSAASGGDYGLPTNQSAVDLADHLWYSYLGGSREGVPRPFGDARLDGIDFFLSAVAPGPLRRAGEGAGEAQQQHPWLWRRAGAAADGDSAVRVPRRECAACAGDGVVRAHPREVLRLPVLHGVDRGRVEPVDGGVPGQQDLPGLTASYTDACYLERKAVIEIVMPIVQKADNYGGVMLWTATATSRTVTITAATSRTGFERDLRPYLSPCPLSYFPMMP